MGKNHELESTAIKISKISKRLSDRISEKDIRKLKKKNKNKNKKKTAAIFCGIIWYKVIKNGPSTICGRQPLKNFTCSILEYFDPYGCRKHHKL